MNSKEMIKFMLLIYKRKKLTIIKQIINKNILIFHLHNIKTTFNNREFNFQIFRKNNFKVHLNNKNNNQNLHLLIKLFFKQDYNSNSMKKNWNKGKNNWQLLGRKPTN